MNSKLLSIAGWLVAGGLALTLLSVERQNVSVTEQLLARVGTLTPQAVSAQLPKLLHEEVQRTLQHVEETAQERVEIILLYNWLHLRHQFEVELAHCPTEGALTAAPTTRTNN